jgi:hypothetical protein
MNIRLITIIVSAAAALTIPAAYAGCGDTSGLTAPIQMATSVVSTSMARAEAKAAQSGETPSIVGLWSFQFISKGNTSIPDGAQVDFGYVQIHSDGTEIMNSGGRAPATENFCLGVWGKTDTNTYQVNHFALSYDAVSGSLNGMVNIAETLTLSPGGTILSGSFAISQYDAKGVTLVAHVVGTISATRITLDSTLP